MKRPEDNSIIVHFKLAEPDPNIRLQLAVIIKEALRDVVVNDHAIVPVLTNADVEMSQTDCERLAKQVLPVILKMLQIPGAGNG